MPPGSTLLLRTEPKRNARISQATCFRIAEQQSVVVTHPLAQPSPTTPAPATDPSRRARRGVADSEPTCHLRVVEDRHIIPPAGTPACRTTGRLVSSPDTRRRAELRCPATKRLTTAAGKIPRHESSPEHGCSSGWKLAWKFRPGWRFQPRRGSTRQGTADGCGAVLDRAFAAEVLTAAHQHTPQHRPCVHNGSTESCKTVVYRHGRAAVHKARDR